MWKIAFSAEKILTGAILVLELHGENFFQEEKFEISTFKLYIVSEKMLYHQRYSTDFKKHSCCWKMWKIGIWAEKFLSAAILVLQWQGENY